MVNEQFPAGSVLVGTDGSAAADVAVDWAAAEATRRSTGLHILYAFPWLTRARAWEFEPPPEITENGNRVVAAAKKRVEENHPGLAVSTEVRIEDPAMALVTSSESAVVTVVGAQGMGAGSDSFLGSVSQKAAAHARSAVVVVRADADLDPDRPVVVGMDPNEGAPEAMEYAFEEAARRGQRLVVVQGSQDDAAFPDFPDAVISGHYDAGASEAAKLTSDRLTAWHKQFPDVPVELRLVRERPVKALVRAGDESSVVVVGSRGRGGLVGLVLGSVSRGVLNGAPVVAVVRSRHELDVERAAQRKLEKTEATEARKVGKVQAAAAAKVGRAESSAARRIARAASAVSAASAPSAVELADLPPVASPDRPEDRQTP
ncbi:universal stress protein [Georgenia sunbinii]|uniref:universal stress protein n=1 Tax=Georgenia sunbinii TaxID=3117728 RepID=UPI002F26AD41